MVNQQQTTFTIAEAAKLYSMDRTTVFQHTKKKQNPLSTQKEKRGGREVAVVELSELVRFYGEVPDPNSKAETQVRKIDANQDNSSVFQVALLEEKLKHQQQMLEQEKRERSQERRQLEAERDRAIEQIAAWQQQAETSQKLLTDEREKTEQKKRWWRFGE